VLAEGEGDISFYASIIQTNLDMIYYNIDSSMQRMFAGYFGGFVGDFGDFPLPIY
jgi:hypothetical protein